MIEDKKYENPTPVSVAIVPIECTKEYTINDGKKIQINLHQVLYVRRAIEPKKGMLALPGGFVNKMERIEQAGAREVFEETSIIIEEEDFQLFTSEITPNNRNLIFGITPPQSSSIIEQLNNNLKNNPLIQEETQEFVIGNLNIDDAAFDLHQKALSKYFDKINGIRVINSIQQYTSTLTPFEIKELVEKIKNDGFLSSNFSYENKQKYQRKI